MATAQTAPRKTLSLPKNAKNIKAALKAGDSAPAAPTRSRKKVGVAEKLWVQTLHGASGFHRDALSIELAVGLAVFLQKADAEKVTLDAKRALNAVYAAAGYACETHTGEDYKTVNRRINVTADLFVKLGGRDFLLIDVMGEGSTPDEGITKLIEMVKSHKFNGPNDVLAFCGKPVTVKRPRNAVKPADTAGQGQMSAEDAELSARLDKAMTQQKLLAALPPERLLHAGPVEVAIPMEATYDDLMDMANQLARFALTKLPQPEKSTVHAGTEEAVEA